MTFARRKAIAALANHAAQLSRRRGAPHLRSDSSRKLVIEWLQWDDPNGSWTDDLAIADGLLPLTETRAWEALSEMIGEP